MCYGKYCVEKKTGSRLRVVKLNLEREKKRKIRFFLSEEKIRSLINCAVIKLNCINSFRESFKRAEYRISLSLSLHLFKRGLSLNYCRPNFIRIGRIVQSAIE